MTADLTLGQGVEAEAEDLDAARQEIANLKAGLESRHVIGLAQGLLMARFQITQEQAFHYLVRRSNESNVKLREVAAQTVEEWIPQPPDGQDTAVAPPRPTPPP